MKKIFLLHILLFTIALSNDFLSPYEYGKALYKNPRGIGCIECHGQRGEGSIISYVQQNGKLKPIIAPKIINMQFDKFEEGLKLGKGFMPKYSLSVSEIMALYIYLNQQLTKD